MRWMPAFAGMTTLIGHSSGFFVYVVGSVIPEQIVMTPVHTRA
jgi:hypothetical protein